MLFTKENSLPKGDPFHNHPLTPYSSLKVPCSLKFPCSFLPCDTLLYMTFSLHEILLLLSPFCADTTSSVKPDCSDIWTEWVSTRLNECLYRKMHCFGWQMPDSLLPLVDIDEIESLTEWDTLGPSWDRPLPPCPLPASCLQKSCNLPGFPWVKK